VQIAAHFPKSFFYAVFILLFFALSACIGISEQIEPPATVAPVNTPVPAETGAWWQPVPGTSWQIELSSAGPDISFDVEMYDIDLFEVSEQIIEQLRADGRVVICYFSAGSWEEWRPDAGQFPKDVIGDPLEGWPGEYWLDIRALDVLAPLMAARLDLAVEKGCDGVDPDNVNAYENPSGFELAYQHQLDFNLWLAEQAHARGLSIGLKNDLNQIPDLVAYYDWALNEECPYYGECEMLLPFVEAGKAVFGVEYELASDEFCPQTNALNFDFLKKNWDLDAWREACR
jgi:hypothetical protein